MPATKQRRAVFFDRDGVLNQVIMTNNKPYPPRSLSELKIPEDAFTALSLLKKHNFLLIGATNQPDVVRGETTKEVVTAINNVLLQQLPLDEIRVCFHDDKDQCDCRKPAPGLLLQAAKEHNINLTGSFMIGDRWKDILAGNRAGCKTIWLQQFPKIWELLPDINAAREVNSRLRLEGRIAILPSNNSPSRKDSRSILTGTAINTNYNEPKPEKPDYIAYSLLDTANWILQNKHSF